MDSKEQFLDNIRKEYNNLTKGQVPSDLVDKVSKDITDYYYYHQYKMF